MHTLVTGGAGFIGSHVVDRLVAEGRRVRVLDSLAPPVHRAGERPAYLSGEVELVVGDVRDRASWERSLDGAEVVFHLAAYQDYLTDFSTFFQVNGVGTALLYEVIAAGRLPVRKIVVASSQATYGEGKYECPKDGVQYPPSRSLEQLNRGAWESRCTVCHGPLRPVPTDEGRVGPGSPYAISKYMQEMIALSLGRRCGVPTVALRYSITQGPRQSLRNPYSGILRRFLRRLLAEKPPVCYEDGEQLRDYVSVHDAARATLLVMEDPRADNEAFNVGSGHGVSVKQYAALVARKLGKDVAPLVPGEFRVGDTRHIVSDIAKLRGLGWEPRVGLDEIVEGYIAWARDRPELAEDTTEAEALLKRTGVVRSVEG